MEPPATVVAVVAAVEAVAAAAGQGAPVVHAEVVG